jgi:hypothetical protein
MTELQVLYAVCAVLGGLFITGIGAAYVVFKISARRNSNSDKRVKRFTGLFQE